MDINLSKQQIITVFKSLISSSNSLKEQIKLENNSSIKSIIECQLEEVDEALEIFVEIIDVIVKENIIK